jgi:hypothetical protein
VTQPPAGGYPPPPEQPGGYPPPPPAGQPPAGPPPGGYPPAPPAGGYPPPPPAGGYPPPPPAGGYAPPPGAPQQPAPGGYPPPPGGGYGPPQPGYGPPQPAGPSINLAKIGVGDWVVIGIGVLMLIFSFIGWQGNSFGSYRNGWGAWFFVIQLVFLATLVIFAIQRLTGQLVKEIPAVYLVYAAALVVVLTIIALVQVFVSDPLGLGSVSGACDGLTGATLAACQSALGRSTNIYDFGPQFGIWGYLVLSIAFAYFIALAVQAKGTKLPFAVPGPKL